MANPLASDLDHILSYSRSIWPELAGRRIFITGGTGFFGCWLLESLLWANDKLKLGAEVTVLSRDPSAFARKAPHLAGNGSVKMLAGDVRTLTPPDGKFDLVIHAAAESTRAALYAERPLEMLEAIVDGTRRMLEFARRCGAGKFLLTSSGAVYGVQDPSVSHVEEESRTGPVPCDLASVYGEGKRLAELLCAVYNGTGLECKIARCFAFLGPYLPTNVHYAAGNFLADALEGRPINIQGDGTPYRSYLYAADLAAWLWTIAINGKPCRPYNVGSERAITIFELAQAVAAAADRPLGIRLARQPVPGQVPQRYVPSTRRARMELGLDEWVGLDEAIRRSLQWHRTIAQGRSLHRD
jgi:nucleoside-diphosphate-sugar epimerase